MWQGSSIETRKDLKISTWSRDGAEVFDAGNEVVELPAAFAAAAEAEVAAEVGPEELGMDIGVAFEGMETLVEEVAFRELPGSERSPDRADAP